MIEHAGIRYYVRRLGTQSYYRASRSAGGGLLHRVLYEEAHGPIPDGWHVHHRDGDSLNNDLDNLVALAVGDHHREHGARGCFAWSPEERAAQKRAEWARRKPRELTCARCGEPFQSTGQRAKFCSRPCQRAAA